MRWTRSIRRYSGIGGRRAIGAGPRVAFEAIEDGEAIRSRW